EGQNLQDAKHVINYDLHWNPVRMIQRAGRIDRLGSIHKEIVIHNFFLEDGLEALLNLMQRIVARLKKIDDAIELDAPVIEMEREYINLNRIQDQDSKIIEEYEEQLEFIGLNQSKKDLLTAIQEIGYEKFAKTPMGIHSGMLTPENSGLMISVKFMKKNMKTSSIYWVYEPDDAEKEFPKLNLQNGIITSKHIIEKIIRCGKTTPRVVLEKPEDIYSRAAKIVRKLEDYQRQKETASSMITKIEAGNKKYYTIIRKAIKHWGLDKQYAKRFIEFLKEKKFDNIRRDPAVQKPLDKFNLEFENIDKAAKYLEDDSGLNKWRRETIEEFLYKIYEYFDSHEILTEKEIRKRSRERVKVILIGIIRVYTTETLKALKEKNS
ncbi:MAG: helicase-related protein, partial [Promethearchaeota archaeon]